MAELLLQPLEGEYRGYELPGAGTLRLGKSLYSKALAESGGRSWTLHRPGLLRPRVVATDVHTGAVNVDMRLRGGAGDFALDGRQLSWISDLGSPIRWYVSERERRLAQFDGPERGRALVRVMVADDARLAPLVLLLGCFMTLRAAEDSTAVG